MTAETGWYMTTNLNEAISEYIGETVIIPKQSYNSFRLAIGKSHIESQLAFYYGKPSEELLERFGYVDSVKEAMGRIKAVEDAHKLATTSKMIFKGR